MAASRKSQATSLKQARRRGKILAGSNFDCSYCSSWHPGQSIANLGDIYIGVLTLDIHCLPSCLVPQERVPYVSNDTARWIPREERSCHRVKPCPVIYLDSTGTYDVPWYDDVRNILVQNIGVSRTPWQKSTYNMYNVLSCYTRSPIFHTKYKILRSMKDMDSRNVSKCTALLHTPYMWFRQTRQPWELAIIRCSGVVARNHRTATTANTKRWKNYERTASSSSRRSISSTCCRCITTASPKKANRHAIHQGSGADASSVVRRLSWDNPGLPTGRLSTRNTSTARYYIYHIVVLPLVHHLVYV